MNSCVAIIALRGLLTFLIHWEIKNEEKSLGEGLAEEKETNKADPPED